MPATSICAKSASISMKLACIIVELDAELDRHIFFFFACGYFLPNIKCAIGTNINAYAGKVVNNLNNSPRKVLLHQTQEQSGVEQKGDKIEFHLPQLLQKLCWHDYQRINK